MANWREQKREARRIVHTTMALDMKFFQTATSSPVDVRARLHTKFTQIGDDRSRFVYLLILPNSFDRTL